MPKETILSILKDIRELLKNQTEITGKLTTGESTKTSKADKPIIDCDVDPSIPYDGWKVETHQRMGKLEFDPTKIDLYLDEKQKTGLINGHDLQKKLKDKKVLNANVLDYLYANPNLIPENWKKDEKGITRYIYFWGTIYRGDGGLLCVRCLSWRGGQWNWNYNYLDNEWNDPRPAALLAK